MTYDMAWKLWIEPDEHDLLAEIERSLEEFEIDEAGETLLDVLSYGEYEAEPINDYGYSPVADVQDFSRNYPRALFILTSTDCENFTGPEEPGYARYYIRDGRRQDSKATVVFELFDEKAAPRKLVHHSYATRVMTETLRALDEAAQCGTPERTEPWKRARAELLEALPHVRSLIGFARECHEQLRENLEDGTGCELEYDRWDFAELSKLIAAEEARGGLLTPYPGLGGEGAAPAAGEPTTPRLSKLIEGELEVVETARGRIGESLEFLCAPGQDQRLEEIAVAAGAFTDAIREVRDAIGEQGV